MQISRQRLVIAVGTGIVVLICTFLFGYFVREPKNVTLVTETGQVSQTSKSIHTEIVSQMTAKNMEQNLRYFAGEAHVAGYERNNRLGDEMFKRFQSFGFEAKKESYTVLLSYPKKSKPNKVSLINPNGSTFLSLKMVEEKLATDEDLSKTIQPYNAYGKAGVVEGDLVYVNYGRESDYKILQEQFNISCNGKVVLARYGKIGRGGKAIIAENQGAAAVLLYHDPENYSPHGAGPAFPHGWWLSSDGVQRGGIAMGDGDPLTPYYPSTEEAFRISETSDETRLPKIPCQPLSMNDGKSLLANLKGKPAPKDWQGGLPLSYNLGPGFGSPIKIRVEVNNDRIPVKITNIFGVIRGAVEPDRYVLVGNHRDAWVNGAADPGSGTSVMMEIARAMGTKVTEGWRPHRTIIFCSWDGEEQGLIGSVEWTEQHAKLLQDRAVAYINLDTVVFGNVSMGGAASPMIFESLFKAAMETEDAHDITKTVFQKYQETYPSSTRPGFPSVRRLGASSDYFAFFHRFGIPSLDLSYRMPNLNKKFNTSFYPVYHTLHDTFTWMKSFVDPKFRCHLTLGRVAASILLSIADTPLIPWNVLDYAFEMQEGIGTLDELFDNANASLHQADTSYLKKAVDKFASSAKSFHDSLKTKELTNFANLRMVNDVLMQLEKGFIYPGGLPGRRDYSHMIYSPPSGEFSLFPTIVDALTDAKKNSVKWTEVKKQVSIVASTIEAIAETMVGGFEL